MSVEPKNLTGVPVLEGDPPEDFVRASYDKTHPGDTFEDLQRRARFDRHDKGLLQDWLAMAADRELQSGVVQHLDLLLAKIDGM